MDNRRRQRFESAKVNYRRRMKPSSVCSKDAEGFPKEQQSMTNRKNAADKYIRKTQTMDPFQLRTSSTSQQEQAPVLYSSMAPQPKYGISFQGSFRSKQSYEQPERPHGTPTQQQDSLGSVDVRTHAPSHHSKPNNIKPSIGGLVAPINEPEEKATNEERSSNYTNVGSMQPPTSEDYRQSVKQKLNSFRPKNGLRAGTLTRFQKNRDGILPEFDANLLRQMNSEDTEQIGNLKTNALPERVVPHNKRRFGSKSDKSSSLETIPSYAKQNKVHEQSSFQKARSSQEPVSKEAPATFHSFRKLRGGTYPSNEMKVASAGKLGPRVVQLTVNDSSFPPQTKTQEKGEENLAFSRNDAGTYEDAQKPFVQTQLGRDNKPTGEIDPRLFHKKAIQKMDISVSTASKEKLSSKTSHYRKMRANKAVKSKKNSLKKGSKRFNIEANHDMLKEYGLQHSDSSGILASGEDDSTNTERETLERRIREPHTRGKKMRRPLPPPPQSRKNCDQTSYRRGKTSVQSSSATQSYAGHFNDKKVSAGRLCMKKTDLSPKNDTELLPNNFQEDKTFSRKIECKHQIELDAAYSANLMNETMNDKKQATESSCRPTISNHNKLRNDKSHRSKKLSREIQATPSQIEATRNILDDLSTIDFDTFVSDRKSTTQTDPKEIRHSCDDDQTPSKENKTSKSLEISHKTQSNQKSSVEMKHAASAQKSLENPSMMENEEHSCDRDARTETSTNNDASKELETLVEKLIDSADKLPDDNLSRAKQRMVIQRACRQLDTRLKKEGPESPSGTPQGPRRGLHLFQQLRRGRSKNSMARTKEKNKRTPMPYSNIAFRDCQSPDNNETKHGKSSTLESGSKSDSTSKVLVLEDAEEQMAAKIMDYIVSPESDEADTDGDPKTSYQLPSLASSTSGTSERPSSPSLDSSLLSLSVEETFSKDSRESEDVGVLSDMFSEILKSTGEDPIIEAAKRLFGGQHRQSRNEPTFADHPHIPSNETSSVFSVHSTNSHVSNGIVRVPTTSASEAAFSAEASSVLSSKKNQEKPKGILRPSSFHTTSGSECPVEDGLHRSVISNKSDGYQDGDMAENKPATDDVKTGHELSTHELKLQDEKAQNPEKGLWKKSVARIFRKGGKKGQSDACVGDPAVPVPNEEKKVKSKKVVFTDKNEIRYHTSCRDMSPEEQKGIVDGEDGQDAIAMMGCSAFPSFAIASSIDDDMSFDSTDQSETWINAFFGPEEPFSDSRSFD